MFQLEQWASSTGIEMKRLLVFLTMTLLLTSCGGGGGNTVATFETPTLTAYYGDASVKGLIYEASPSGLSGVTDERGSFNFKREDSVSFYIDPVNRIYIGKVKPVHQEIVIPAVDNIFDPEVDASFVRFILYGFDMAMNGSSYMDFTNLIMSSTVVNKVKNILSRRETPNLIDDTWQGLADLQAEAVGYTFKNSGSNISKLSFNLNYFNSVSNIKALNLNREDYRGAYFISYGLTGAHFNFMPDGTLVAIRDDGAIALGSYVKNSNNVSYRWSDDQPDECDYSISLRKKGVQLSLITIDENDTPNGCRYNINHNDVLTMAKINESFNIEYISGKRLRIPVRGLCAFGDGDAILNISSAGPTLGQRSVDMTSLVCTANQLISGSVRESSVPGVLVFEFDSISPKAKVFFSILQDSGRARTQLSIEKTVPNVEFDFVYGAESTFTLE